jgi:hypothetical protein
VGRFLANFLSILRTIVGVETVAAPIAERLLPQYAAPIALLDNMLHHITASVIRTEAANPGDGQGQVKMATVMSDFQYVIDNTNAFLATIGKQGTYDTTKLQAVVDAQVAVFNNMRDLKASFKVVDSGSKPVQ